VTQGLQGGEKLILLSGGVQVRNGDKVRVEAQEN